MSLIRSCCSKDFVMYVGGHVWALDWCPRIHTPDNHFKCEFIAVAAHPPGSSYHKIGAPLTGRGVIQIWCILNVSMNEEEVPASIEKSTLSKRPRGRPRKKPIEDNEAITTQSKRPRGRPRKNPIEESLDNLNCIDQHVQALAVQLPEDASEAHAVDGVPRDAHEHAVQEDGGKKDHSDNTSPLLLTKYEDMGSSVTNHQIQHNSGQEPAASDNVLQQWLHGMSNGGLLVHVNPNVSIGWAILLSCLGSGSLEVWEVPLPRTMKVIYSSVHQEGTDPRFVKLEPVFRCSMLKCGGIQSIPLTVEWSASPPHEYLLAGCHDGTVALWKFSASYSSKDTRPLLCFSADTVPIRALSWAPLESRPASTWYQSKTPIPTPAVNPTKPENKTSQPNPMTKINLIYLPHEICAAAKAAAAEAAAKALIHTNTPTQTNPIAKPTIPLRSRLPPYHHHLKSIAQSTCRSQVRGPPAPPTTPSPPPASISRLQQAPMALISHRRPPLRLHREPTA
uniref:Uncharacterized protein n=1 Tax=Fagus sylvatica TaxID=28930 RepID=A0A2N9ED58_FAGSY